VGLRERKSRVQPGSKSKSWKEPSPRPATPAAARIIKPPASGPGQSAVPACRNPPDPGRWPVKAARRSAHGALEWLRKTLPAGRICPALVQRGGWPASRGPEHSEARAPHCRSEASTTSADGPKWPVSPILKGAERFASRITADPTHGCSSLRVGEPYAVLMACFNIPATAERGRHPGLLELTEKHGAGSNPPSLLSIVIGVTPPLVVCDACSFPIAQCARFHSLESGLNPARFCLAIAFTVVESLRPSPCWPARRERRHVGRDWNASRLV